MTVISINPRKLLPRFEAAVRDHLNAMARERQYDDILSIFTYINSTDPIWSAEARAFSVWRDAVWAYAFAELNKVKNGERTVPTVKEFIDELPVMRWPEHPIRM